MFLLFINKGFVTFVLKYTYYGSNNKEVLC